MTWHFRTLNPRAICLACLLLPQTNLYAKEAEYIEQEAGPATTVDEIDTPLEQGLTKPEPARRFGSQLKDKLKDQAPFLRDTQLTLKPRTYYFNRDNSGTDDREAWALGGGLKYKSGLWEERVQAGVSLYTSQKLYGPKDKGGTLLLKPGQKSFSTVGEAYLNIRTYEENYLQVYRQELNVPYVNRQDSRMVPNSFEAYTLYNKDNPNFTYILSHVEKMKKRNSDEFISMSEAAGFTGKDKDLTMLGGLYSLNKNTDIGIITQQSWDLMNTTYAEANTKWQITEDWDARLPGLDTKQRSIGDEIGGDIDTDAWGVAFSVGYGGILATIATTRVDEDSRIRTPYGGYPGYLSLMHKDFNRADEEGHLIGVSSDLRFLNTKGLSANINMAWGDTPDSGENSSPDQKELDVTLDYRLPEGPLKSLWIRARAAHVDQDRHPNEVDSTDYRLIMNYEIPIL